MGLLEGKVALVTGAAGGIGRASSKALAREGASVVCADVYGEGAKEIAAEIVADGGRAIAVEVDQSDEPQVIRTVEAAIAEYGRVDILFNNGAATGLDTVGQERFIHELDLEVWNRTYAVNVGGCMLFVKHVVPHMLVQGGGAIINTASGTGIHAEFYRAAYGSSKAAVIGFTRNVATQYGKESIRCNAIAPGLIITPAVERNLTPEEIEVLARHHLTPRLGVPDDIASLVVFLASDQAAFITGITIPVDGGMTSHNPTYAEAKANFDAEQAGLVS